MHFYKAIAILLLLVPSLCFGADPNIYYVCVTPDGSNPGAAYSAAYPTLTLAEATIPADLTKGGIGGGGTVYNIHIIGDWSGKGDTTQVNFSGSTSGDTTYINVTCPTSGDVLGGVTDSTRHAGVWSTAKYRLTVNAVQSLLTDHYVRLDGLQISNSQTTAGSKYAIYGKFASKGNRYNSILLYALTVKAGVTDIGLYDAGLSNNVYVTNCVAAGMSGIGFSLDSQLAGGVTIFNNTAYYCAQGFAWAANEPWVYNNLAYACTTSDFDSDAAFSAGNNSSSDATAPIHSVNTEAGVTYFRHISDPFVSSGTSNFHLSAGAAIINWGASGVTFAAMTAVDFEGESRPQGSAWDIGADEYVSSTPSATTPTRRRVINIIQSWLRWLTPSAWAGRE